MPKSKKYIGVYRYEGKRGVTYGIDYTHPLTFERVRKIVKATSEAKASELRSIEIADAKRGAVNKVYGIKAKKKSVLFEDMIDVYLEWSKEEKESWQTDRQRSQALRRSFKGKLMSDINPFIVEKYKSFRKKSVSKSTVNKELILAGQIFEKAVEWEKYNGENPFSGKCFKLPKPKKPGSLTPDQVKSIMDEIRHPVKKDIVEFYCHVGWRIGKIIRLKWEDVEFEKGTAWLVNDKNGKTVELPLSDDALAILRRQERRSEYVFCHLNGKPFRSYLYGMIKKAFERAGVPRPKNKAWHLFRRSWASWFLQSGGDVESLRVQGNWEDSTMPLYYADDPGTENRREILNRFPKLNGRNLAEKGKVVSLSGRKH